MEAGQSDFGSRKINVCLCEREREREPEHSNRWLIKRSHGPLSRPVKEVSVFERTEWLVGSDLVWLRSLSLRTELLH